MAALVAQQHPNWDADELKPLLTSTATGVPGQAPYGVGSGRVDAENAVSETVFALQSSLSFGYFRWPYDDTEPISKQVTFRNDSSEAVTLDLDLQVFDQTGAPAAPGIFSGPSTVTVPANATADAMITFAADTGPAGTYGGVLTAQSADGQHQARVAVGGVKEPESYDVTVNALNRDGAIPEAGTLFNSVIFFNYDTATFVVKKSGETARLPVGTYAINAYISTARPGKSIPAMAQMSYPEIEIDQDRVVTLDAREAQRLRFTVDDRPNAELQYRYQHMMVKQPDSGSLSYFAWTMGTTADWDEMYVSGANASDRFAFAAQARLKEPSGDAYNLTFTNLKRVPSVDFHARAKHLGRIKSHYRGFGGGDNSRDRHASGVPGSVPVQAERTVTVPDTHTEYFTAGVPLPSDSRTTGMDSPRHDAPRREPNRDVRRRGDRPLIPYTATA